MSFRKLEPKAIESEWPRLMLLLAEGDPEEYKKRVRHLLSGKDSYALVAEGAAGVPTGLAVVEHYQSAWVFDDQVASIREFLASDTNTQGALLEAIDLRARSGGMSHLQRFLAADDESLSWWFEAGFVEYMTALRKALDARLEVSVPDGRDGITIRAISDLEADWPKLWPLLDRLDFHHASLTGRPLHDHREGDTRRIVQQEIEGSDALVMLAELDGRAVATSSAELGEKHADGSRTGYRSRLFIEEPYRGLGLSPRFEAVALEWFREREVTHVERWIVAGNERPRQIWSARGYKAERILLRKALPS